MKPIIAATFAVALFFMGTAAQGEYKIPEESVTAYKLSSITGEI